MASLTPSSGAGLLTVTDHGVLRLTNGTGGMESIVYSYAVTARDSGRPTKSSTATLDVTVQGNPVQKLFA